MPMAQGTQQTDGRGPGRPCDRGGSTSGRDLPGEATPPLLAWTPPATCSSRGSWKLEAAPREDTTAVAVAKGHSWLIPGPGSHPGELRICHTQGSGIKGHLPHLRGPKEVEEWIKQNPRTQSARQVRCCGVSL